MIGSLSSQTVLIYTSFIAALIIMFSSYSIYVYFRAFFIGERIAHGPMIVMFLLLYALSLLGSAVIPYYLGTAIRLTLLLVILIIFHHFIRWYYV